MGSENIGGDISISGAHDDGEIDWNPRSLLWSQGVGGGGGDNSPSGSPS